MRVNRATFVLSQSCSWLTFVVSASVRIIWLTVSLSCAISPRASTVIDRVRSPCVTAVATSRIARTWFVRLPASSLTLFVRSRPHARGAWHVGLTAEATVDADVARDARDLIGERRQRVDHVVDRVDERRDLAARREVELRIEVAVGDRGDDGRDAAHLLGEVARHDVDVVGQLAPRTADTPRTSA